MMKIRIKKYLGLTLVGITSVTLYAMHELTLTDQKLITAAIMNNAQQVKAALDVGADVNAKDAEGLTALHQAARRGYTAVVKELIDAKANVNAMSPYGTPLIMAVRFDEAGAVSQLLAAKADVYAATPEGWTALHEAAKTGYSPVAKLLIEAGADVNAKDKQGRSALKVALEYEKVFANKPNYGNRRNYAEIVKQLIAAGADYSDLMGNPLVQKALAELREKLV